MSYREQNTADPGIIDMLEGFKRLSHAIQEDIS